MRPRRTWLSNAVYRLVGGNEDNDLFLFRDSDANGLLVLRSTWEPTDEEREAIATGANVELIVWGDAHPPVAMGVVHYPLGAKPREEHDEEQA